MIEDFAMLGAIAPPPTDKLQTLTVVEFCAKPESALKTSKSFDTRRARGTEGIADPLRVGEFFFHSL
jgi:hypothetical protein